jgi:dUTP pyrophosphatase
MTHYVLKLRVVSDDPELLNLYKNVSVAKMETQEYLENPHKDSGFDIYTPKGNEHICPGETRLVNLEIQCAAYKIVCDGDTCQRVPSAFYMYPRSSIYKTPLRLANNTGIIDSGYRGNLMGAFDNICRPGSKDQHGTWEQELNMYGRMLQICMPDLSPFKVEIVETLDDTSRGAGGLGSTGV